MSPRQQRALAFLSRSPPPTLAELATHLECSKSGARVVLERLQALGYIQREAGRHRAVSLVR